MATSQKQGPERMQGGGRLLTTEDLAELLNTTRAAIYQMRYRGEGPRSVRLDSRSVRYRPEDVDAWLEERAAAVEAERQEQAPAPQAPKTPARKTPARRDRAGGRKRLPAAEDAPVPAA